MNRSNGAPLDRRREDMAIVGIGQGQYPDQILEVRHQRIADLGVHHLPRPLQPLPDEIGAGAQQRVDPFVMDLMRPFRPIEVGECDL